MTKRFSFPLTSAVILFLITLALTIYYYTHSNLVPVTPIDESVSYTTVTDNELVILHSNVLVTADQTAVQLTLTNHSKTADGVASSITVADQTGSVLGTIEFSAINETQTIGDYRFRLVSATNSAVQILVLATVAE